jgi:hypothetical protein
MYDYAQPKIPSPLIHAIEDAVMFGNVKEIDGILEMVHENETFPRELRYGLEALMYYRLTYGKGGDLEPIDKDDREKVLMMESHWGRELIEMIGHYPDMTEAKYA